MTTHRVGYTLWPLNFDLVEPGSFLDEAEELGGDIDIVEMPGSLSTEDLITMVAEGDIDYTVADENIAVIAQAANQAREELRSSVASLAVLGASKILEKEVDADTHRELLDKLIAEI